MPYQGFDAPIAANTTFLGQNDRRRWWSSLPGRPFYSTPSPNEVSPVSTSHPTTNPQLFHPVWPRPFDTLSHAFSPHWSAMPPTAAAASYPAQEAIRQHVDALQYQADVPSSSMLPNDARPLTPTPTSSASSNPITSGASMPPDPDAGRTCLECQVVFANHHVRRRHENETHRPKKFYACPDCSGWRIPQWDVFGNQVGHLCFFCGVDEPDAPHFINCHFPCLSWMDIICEDRRGKFVKHLESCSSNAKAEEWRFDPAQSCKRLACDVCGLVLEGCKDYKKHRKSERNSARRKRLLETGRLDPSSRLSTMMRGLLMCECIQQHWVTYLNHCQLVLDVDAVCWNFSDTKAIQALTGLESVRVTDMSTSDMQQLMECFELASESCIPRYSVR